MILLNIYNRASLTFIIKFDILLDFNMEWLNKLTNPLAERARSPFFGTFIISWLIWNWRIVITVLMPNQTNRGKIGLIQYISENYLNTYDCFVIPLIVSLVYIFLLPLIDLGLMEYTEVQKRKKVDKKLKIGRKHKVSGDIYYDLKLQFEKEKKKIIEADSRTKKLKAQISERDTRISELNTQVLESKNSYDRVRGHFDNLNNRHDISKVFQGRWHLTWEQTAGPILDKGEEEIDIHGTQYSIIKNTVAEHRFDIALIDFDIERKRFTFVKFNVVPGNTSGSVHCVDELRIVDNDWFEGKENRTINVTYRRRDPDKQKNDSDVIDDYKIEG